MFSRSFNFQVIEVVIRAQVGFSKELIRHMNFIEQEVVLHLAWQKTSPLFETVRRIGKVPTTSQTQRRYTRSEH